MEKIFLSTPSARRATLSNDWIKEGMEFLSTPSARRATKIYHAMGLNKEISIHALREEGDTSRLPQTYTEYIFLSTPSARRATVPASSSLIA